jgi:hypothetical protein
VPDRKRSHGPDPISTDEIPAPSLRRSRDFFGNADQPDPRAIGDAPRPTQPANRIPRITARQPCGAPSLPGAREKSTRSGNGENGIRTGDPVVHRREACPFDSTNRNAQAVLADVIDRPEFDQNVGADDTVIRTAGEAVVGHIGEVIDL